MSPPPDPQFAEMVDRARTGNNEAIASFIKHFEVPILRFIQRSVGNDEVAKDLYSELTERVCKAFKKGLKKAGEGLRKPLAARAWIFKF